MGLRVNCERLSACPIAMFSGAAGALFGGLSLLVSTISGAGRTAIAREVAAACISAEISLNAGDFASSAQGSPRTNVAAINWAINL